MGGELRRGWGWAGVCITLLVGGGCASVARHLPAARRARIAFLNVERQPGARADALLTAVMRHGPDTVWYRGNPFGKHSARAGWKEATICARTRGRGCGPVQVVTIGAAEPLDPDSPGWQALVERLSQGGTLWKVVLLERSPILPRTDRARLELERLLERAGVALVISAGSDGYARSVPIGPNAARVTRHIVLGAGVGDETGPEPLRSVVAFAASGAHWALLDATPGQLTWMVYAEDGTLCDAVTVRSGERRAGFSTLSEVLAEERDARAEGTGTMPGQEPEK